MQYRQLSGALIMWKPADGEHIVSLIREAQEAQIGQGCFSAPKVKLLKGVR